MDKTWFELYRSLEDELNVSGLFVVEGSLGSANYFGLVDNAKVFDGAL